MFVIEDLRTGEKQEIHSTRLKFFRDSSINEEAVMSHVLSSETGMPVSRLMSLGEKDDRNLFVRFRWRGLPDSEDTWRPLQRINQDALRLVRLLLNRQNTPAPLRERAEAELRH